ncbi:unnamed protein product [Brassica oleracea]|uniref:Uncharacterized protein n=1 Tax=Brassica oleracea TaxID=3712 RepID=A0A3P6EFX1_BRAOL|nr:unnamed protein product [Brassica oleracea]
MVASNNISFQKSSIEGNQNSASVDLRDPTRKTKLQRDFKQRFTDIFLACSSTSSGTYFLLSNFFIAVISPPSPIAITLNRLIWKGIPLVLRQKILDLCKCNTRADLRNRVHLAIDKYTEPGLRSLAVARWLYVRKPKISSGGPCEFIGLLPLFGLPKHDNAYTIRRASDLGVNIQMITGYYLFIQQKLGGPSVSDYKKLQSEKSDLQIKYYEVFAKHQGTLRERKSQLRVEVFQEIKTLPLYGDRVKLQLILADLLRNIVKSCPVSR